MEISSPSTLSRRHFLAYSARLLGTALGAGSLFSACGSGIEPLLTIMVNMPSHYLTEFQKRYPSLRILQQPENRTKLITSLMGRVGIDVFEYVDEDVPVFAHEGVLADLSSYSAKDPILPPSNLLPVNDAYRWNGTVLGQGPRYALASSWSYPLLWFNKTLFDQQGISYPSETVPMSYDKLLALGRRLTVHEGNEIRVYGLEPGWNTGMLYGLLVQNLAQAGTSLFSSDQTRADFTTPQAKELLQWYVTWAQAGIGPSPVTPANVTNVQILYRQGKLAMMIADTSVAGISSPLVPSPLSSQTGFAPLPQWGARRLTGCFASQGIGLAAFSQHKDVAWKFLEYYTAGPPAQDRIAATGLLPVVRSLLHPVQQPTAAQHQLLWRILEQQLPYNTALPFSPYIHRGDMIAAIEQSLTAVMQGQMPLDEMARQLTETVNQRLKEGKQAL